MNVKKYSVHISFLIAITILGNAVMVMPFLNAENYFLSFLLCSAFVLIVSLAFLPSVNRLRGFWFYVLAFAIILISFYGATAVFFDYIRFLKSIGVNKIISVVTLIILVAALTVCSNSAFFKFALLFGIIITAFVLLLFVMSIGNYRFSNINLNTLKFDFKLSVVWLVKYFSPVLSALMLARLSNCTAKIKNTVFGVLTGIVLLLLCLCQSVFMLGNTAIAYQTPYLASVAAYSSGQLYIRQDGLVWFVFFAASVIKISLCTKTIYMILKTKKGNQI